MYRPGTVIPVVAAAGPGPVFTSPKEFGMVNARQGTRRTGVRLALSCLLLLGIMPIISNGRPTGASALTFASQVTLWQLLFSLPLQIREWRSGERGLFRAGAPAYARPRLVLVTLFTGLLFALSTWAYVLAFEKVGAVNAAIALQVYPLCAAGLEAVLLRRRKSRAELAVIGVIVVALYYLATRGTWRMTGLSPWFAVALAVPALWSVAHVILRQTLITTPITPNQVTTSRLLVSASCLLPLALIIEGPSDYVRAGTQVDLQGFAVLMGAAYYLELVLWFNAVRHVDVSVASTITVPAPVVTTLFAVTLLGEPAHGYQFVALAVVVLGLLALLRAESRRPDGADGADGADGPAPDGDPVLTPPPPTSPDRT